MITTCSMYLNEHYVALQRGFATGEHLSATILDPHQDAGDSHLPGDRQQQRASHRQSSDFGEGVPGSEPIQRRQMVFRPGGESPYGYGSLRELEARMEASPPTNCNTERRPVAVLPCPPKNGHGDAKVFVNGPERPCKVQKAACTAARRDFSASSPCPHVYATSRIGGSFGLSASALALKYFPGMMEHRDIINLAYDKKICALYFFEPSREHGPFLSELDHARLSEYHAFGPRRILGVVLERQPHGPYHPRWKRVLRETRKVRRLP